MIKNYLTIAIRNMRKEKLTSFINIIGLTIGITFFLLLFSYVWDELTYDRFHDKSDRIYLLYANDNQLTPRLHINNKIGEAASRQFPEIQNRVAFFTFPMVAKYGGLVEQEMITFAQSSFFDIFNFPLKYGNSHKVLDQLSNVVISEEIAQKYFDNDQPVGKEFTISFGSREEGGPKRIDVVVSGVLKTIPGNSSIKPKIIISIGNKSKFGFSDHVTGVTFFELKKNTSVSGLKAKISSLSIDNNTDKARYEQVNSNNLKYSIMKFTDFHFGAIPGTREVKSHSEILNVIIYSALAIGVLLLACFNYMNLSIGNYTSRLKEIGTRKIIGAQGKEIFKQFLTEAGFVTITAFIVGMILTKILLPAFNQLTGKSLAFEYLLSWQSISILLLLLFVTTFVTGSYPAFVLSRIGTVDVIKGRALLGSKKTLSRFFIVMQFCIAVFLITGTLLLRKQINFIRSQDLGFNPGNVVTINNYSAERQTALMFKESLKGSTLIQQISCSEMNNAAGMTDGNYGYYTTLIKDGKEVNIIELSGDYDYINTLNMNLIQGRLLSEKYPSDRGKAIVVNESFIKAFNLKNPIGKQISEFSFLKNSNEYSLGLSDSPTIVGVVKDIHTASLHNEIKPVSICYTKYTRCALSSIIVRIAPGKTSEAIALLKQKWSSLSPDPFIYRFLDEELNFQYKEENMWNEIFGYTSFFAIVIACMGLLGFSALSIARRKKEIGIRKVLGAELKSLILLLIKEYVALICTAGIITFPFIIYFGNKWLDNFVYKTNIGIDTILLPLFIALIISLVTISYNTIKATLTNPIETIKNE